MGFEVKAKELVIQFADEEYMDVMVLAKMPTVREALAFEKVVSKVNESGNPDENDLKRIYDTMAKFIVEWNLEIGGKPLPVKGSTFLDIPKELANGIISGWIEGSSGVSGPLDEGSPSGEISQVVAVPMEAL